MDGHRDVVIADELEGAKMMLGRVIVLGSRQVERHYAAVLVSHRQLSHFERRLGRDVPDAAENHVGNDAMVFLGIPKTGQHGFDDGREPETAPRMEHRRVAHLHVANVLGGSVLAELVGNPVERLRGLQNLERHVEGFQVVDERPCVLPTVQRLRKSLWSVGGQGDALLFGELEHRRQTQRAVQVHVQVGFWQPSNFGERQLHHSHCTRLTADLETA